MRPFSLLGVRRFWMGIFAVTSVAAIIGGAFLIFGRGDKPQTPRAIGPFPQEAYVWQRDWTPAVREAISSNSNPFSRLVVLAAQVSPADPHAPIVRVPIDYATLRESKVSIGLAIRIGPFAGPFATDDSTTRLLSNLAAAVLADARAAGLPADELQIDFDAAESKLAGYRVWIEAIKKRVSPTPVVITALPAWLNRPQLRELLAAADGWVLQVHSVERPAGPDSPMTLCDPARVRKWVEQAARLNAKPFRVALPTYSCLVGFDSAGKYLGVSAEGPAPTWTTGAADAKVRLLRANPNELAGLVRDWQTDRPAALAGIIWYRLPTADDRMNWRMTTLRRVMAGQNVQPDLRVELTRPEPGLIDVRLVNRGDADAGLDVTVSVRWPPERGGQPIAADALEGFTIKGGKSGGADHRIEFTWAGDGSGFLSPGDSRPVGWVRLVDDKEVTADVQPMDH